MKKILVVGSINMDMVIKTPYMPKNGETLTGSDFLLNSGGKGANQAVAIAKINDNTINKSLTAVATISGSLKNECSLEKPRIIIENSGPIAANYCYIEAFSRFYYIDNQTILSNNRINVEMTVDVLESFKNGILALDAIIDNSTKNYDNYLDSDLWRANVKTKTDILNLINDEILALDTSDITIPIGSLVLPEIFSGRGAGIPAVDRLLG